MRRPIWPPRAAWRFLAAQGLALFCLNFLCFYYAEQVVPSGLVAVVFSTATLLNSLNGRLFMGRPLQPSALAVLGLLLVVAGIWWRSISRGICLREGCARENPDDSAHALTWIVSSPIPNGRQRTIGI